MAAGKAIIGVLESGTEVRGLIEECNCGRCCEPGDYVEVADIIRWYIEKHDVQKIAIYALIKKSFLKNVYVSFSDFSATRLPTLAVIGENNCM